MCKGLTKRAVIEKKRKIFELDHSDYLLKVPLAPASMNRNLYCPKSMTGFEKLCDEIKLHFTHDRPKGQYSYKYWQLVHEMNTIKFSWYMTRSSLKPSNLAKFRSNKTLYARTALNHTINCEQDPSAMTPIYK